MPPRVNRRSTRFTSQEPEQAPSQESPNSLIRPNLPALQGTPSTRRQYTYGSAAEPPPRVGAGLQRMDLSSAVNQAISKRVGEDEKFTRPARPRLALARAVNDDTSDNETRPGLGAAQLLSTVRDDDSSRSFGLESDYYEDATIGSVPPSKAGAERPQAASNLNSRSQRDTSVQRSSQPSRLRDQLSAATQPSLTRGTQQTTLDTSRQTRQKSHDADEAEPERRTAPGTRSRTTANTPAPNRTRQSQPQSHKHDIVEDSQEDDSSDDDDIENRHHAPNNARRASTTTQTITHTTMNPRFRLGSQELSRDAAAKRRASGNQGRFSQGNGFQPHSGAFAKIRLIPEDRQERDRLIQQEIQEAEDQSERERAARQPESQVMRWKLWFTQCVAWLSSLRPFDLIRRRREAGDFDDFDEDEYNQGGPTQWSRLLNPMTWLEALLWFIERTMDQLIELIDRLSGVQMRGSSMENLLWAFALGSISLLLGFSFFVGFGTLGAYVPSFPEMGSMPSTGIHWPSPSGFVSGVGNIMPSFSWPSWRKDDDETGIWETFPTDNIQSSDELKKVFEKLQSNLNVHNKALKRLESKLPKVIHMDLVDGRPVIKQEFWHALRDLLREDESFLNMEKKDGNHEVSLEQQWKAIVRRLEKDPDFTMKLNDRVDRTVEDKLPSFWDTWFKSNSDVLEPLIEKVSTKKQSAGSGVEFDQKLVNIVNEQLKKQNQTAVSRTEFLTHLKSDLATHRTEIQAEFDQRRKGMEDYVQNAIRTAQAMAPQGLSEAEVEKIARKILIQAIEEGSLKAVAETEIHLDWNSRLKHEVNFFAVGAGATIDTRLTTTTWDPYKQGIAPDDTFARGLAGTQPLPPIAALRPWQEEGDCWCSADSTESSGKLHGARLSIQLGHTVVPSDIAIEHIFSDATTDPDARPKLIDVFARFDNKTERDSVFNEIKHFIHDNTDESKFVKLPDVFLKISSFEYRGDKLNGGVHVEHINDKFINACHSFGIATEQIIVRARSKHGPTNHTCFYRVRLFGKRMELSVSEDS